ncbi:MAG: energy transducer TonB [Candidatus Rifleibacteriota bacterium]
MKTVKLVKKQKSEGYEEIKLSILIHLAILLALSAFFAWRQVNAEPVKKKVVPVKLISPVAKPRVGSGNKPEKTSGSKKSKGKTRKKVKKTKKKPAAKPVKKVKKVKKPKPQTSKKTKNRKKTATKKKKAVKKIETPVKAKTPVTKSKPAVVQPEKEKKPIKPSHLNPTFDSVGYLSPEPGDSNQIDSELAGLDMGEPANELMPDSFLNQEKEVTMPDNFVPDSVGLKDSKKDDGSGLFEVGSIESFGGNGENFSAPGILRKVLPDYPTWARKEGVRGNATYRVLIQPSGTVGDVVTMNSTIDPKLAINGAQALRRWVFTPVLKNGDPQETWVKITVQYKLN